VCHKLKPMKNLPIIALFCLISFYSKAQTEKLDSTLIGKPLDSIMVYLNVDSTQLKTFQEPPIITRGVWGYLADSTNLVMYVERTFGGYHKIKDNKIIGIGWTDKKGNTFYYGKIISYYPITNRYFKK
jgi:hypothetical protein